MKVWVELFTSIFTVARRQVFFGQKEQGDGISEGLQLIYESLLKGIWEPMIKISLFLNSRRKGSLMGGEHFIKKKTSQQHTERSAVSRNQCSLYQK